MDWISEARFTPKNKVSKHKYGTARVYYNECRGMIVLLYFDKEIQSEFVPYAGFINVESTGSIE